MCPLTRAGRGRATEEAEEQRAAEVGPEDRDGEKMACGSACPPSPCLHPLPAFLPQAKITLHNVMMVLLWAFYLFLIFYVQGAFKDQKPFDPYEILGVSRGATVQEIRKAWRRLSLQYHPGKTSAGLSGRPGSPLGVGPRPTGRSSRTRCRQEP